LEFEVPSHDRRGEGRVLRPKLPASVIRAGISRQPARAIQCMLVGGSEGGLDFTTSLHWQMNERRLR
jgi:hypothetical protein